jgi:hypothetical protein
MLNPPAFSIKEAIMSSLIRRLEKYRDTEWKRRFKGLPYRTVIAERMSMVEAMTDPRLGQSAAEFLAMAAATVVGRADTECFGCCRRWSLDRYPVMMVCIELLPGAERKVLAGLCQDCGFDDAVLKQALSRDFHTDNVRQVHGTPGSA